MFQILTSMFNKFISSSILIMAVALTLILGEDNVLFSSSETNTRVAAGGNGSLWDTYSPQSVEINAGESVTWFNPSPVAEPHTVSFIKDQDWFPPLAVPFNIPNDAKIVSTTPNRNVEPIILPPSSTAITEGKTVVMENSRAYTPVAIDSTGKTVTPLQPNSNYAMSGNETYINSGVMLPVGQSPPGLPPINEFTVTFENPGTYGYVCIFHPRMGGNVVVS